MKEQQSHETLRLQVAAPAGHGLRARFDWKRDRYGHRIEWFDAHRSTTLLEAVGGDEQAPWPPSPPLQQASILDIAPARRAVLLVGMAGRSHWSASVEPGDDDCLSLVFDLACRAAVAPPWLGSTYRTCCPYRMMPEGDLQLMAAGEVSVWLSVVQLPEHPATANAAEGVLRVAPLMRNVVDRGTFRWKYRLSLHRVGWA